MQVQGTRFQHTVLLRERCRPIHRSMSLPAATRCLANGRRLSRSQALNREKHRSAAAAISLSWHKGALAAVEWQQRALPQLLQQG